MVKVLPRRRRVTVRLGGMATGLSSLLTLAMIAALAGPTQAQPGGQTKGSAPPAAKGDGDAKDQAKDAAKSKDDGKEAEPTEPPPDPSQLQKLSPVEIFKDPAAQELIDLKKFNPIRNRPADPADIGAVKEMAANPAAPVDATIIRRMIGGMIAQLTDTKNIQSLIDPPPGSIDSRAIETATRNLQEPLFAARASKSNTFLNEYNRALVQMLPAVLKNHLVPRIQAMIVLGQTGSPEALKIFLDEIRNKDQTVWVKLWALRGLSNIVRYNETPRLNNQQTVDAAKVVAEFLDGNEEMPWPVKYRALEALSYLRQGAEPKSPKEARMAKAAAKVLAAPKARLDIRAEAARALGMMQITNAVTDYNFKLVAYLAGQVAAGAGEAVLSSYSDKGPPLNAAKAQYMTALLVGPLSQVFEGQPGVRDSGLLHNPAAASSRSDIQKVQGQITAVAKSALELVRAPAGQRAAERKDLEAQIGRLKEFLAKNVPANGHLVPGDEGLLNEDSPAAAAAEGEGDASPPAAEKPSKPDRPASKVAGNRGRG
ncbi:hypothetical protein OJF2_15580 [Aquisphaera giovannonii]|uniref:HEAT repeat protein n=1 Tax=Aquisphaera giovannonii TaxID=406548 RepID=A0A5B9VXQ5_9BACT|nr:hypothetical protein [Aquisphaera giovannonii]QEH33062.1 hypothetical protein OJF2_15580 [Aquisphaera giovannonii]